MMANDAAARVLQEATRGKDLALVDPGHYELGSLSPVTAKPLTVYPRDAVAWQFGSGTSFSGRTHEQTR